MVIPSMGYWVDTVATNKNPRSVRRLGEGGVVVGWWRKALKTDDVLAFWGSGVVVTVR
jgi:hypothetical protein